MKYSIVARSEIPVGSPNMILFPVDLAGPLTIPPFTSTVLHQGLNIDHRVPMTEEKALAHINDMREQKRKNLLQALDNWDEIMGGVEVGMMIPSSVMLSVESTWDFVFPELIASLFFAIAPQKVFIDLGGYPFPYERVLLIASKYFEMMEKSSGMIFKSRSMESTSFDVYLIVSSTHAKEVKDWCKNKPYIHVAPFMLYDIDIEVNLELQFAQMDRLFGSEEWMPVIASVDPKSAGRFHEIVGKYGNTIPIMWSKAAMKGLDLTKQWYRTITVKSNNAACLWEKKSRNSRVIAAIDPGEKMNLKIVNEKGDECWAQVIDIENGKSRGYFLWKFQGQEKVTFLD